MTGSSPNIEAASPLQHFENIASLVRFLAVEAARQDFNRDCASEGKEARDG